MHRRHKKHIFNYDFFHTFTAESTMQGDSQLVKRVQGEVSCSGIELANFRLPVNPLYVAVVGT